MNNKLLELLLEIIEKAIDTTKNVHDKAYKIDKQHAEYYKGYINGLKWSLDLIKISLGK